MYKQAIVVRKDVEMGKGKTAVQVAHASIGAAEKVGREISDSWRASGGKKIVLKTEGEDGLLELQKASKREGVQTFLVRDAGKTQVESGTATALGIGPAEESKVDRITGKLKLL